MSEFLHYPKFSKVFSTPNPLKGTFALVIEIDGEVHLDRTVTIEDQSKDESLIAAGLHVMRFTNDEVKNVDNVVFSIKKAIFMLEEKGPLGDLGVEGAVYDFGNKNSFCLVCFSNSPYFSIYSLQVSLD